MGNHMSGYVVVESVDDCLAADWHNEDYKLCCMQPVGRRLVYGCDWRCRPCKRLTTLNLERNISCKLRELQFHQDLIFMYTERKKVNKKLDWIFIIFVIFRKLCCFLKQMFFILCIRNQSACINWLFTKAWFFLLFQHPANFRWCPAYRDLIRWKQERIQLQLQLLQDHQEKHRYS